MPEGMGGMGSGLAGRGSYTCSVLGVVLRALSVVYVARDARELGVVRSKGSFGRVAFGVKWC